jgi:hypothetical protein
MTTPLTSPIAPHTSSGTSSAGSTPYWLAQAARTPPSANTEPTDRSIPPPMITKVIPSATMISVEDWIAMPLRLSNPRNDGKTTEETTRASTSTASAPCRWARAAIRSLVATRLTGICWASVASAGAVT